MTKDCDGKSRYIGSFQREKVVAGSFLNESILKTTPEFSPKGIYVDYVIIVEWSRIFMLLIRVEPCD